MKTLTLRELRQSCGVTQEVLAAKAGIAQSEISRAERRKGHYVSFLRRYVRGLDGVLEVRIRFGDKIVVLKENENA
jgi:transcriptional regulator with XRE-family HTH domain